MVLYTLALVFIKRKLIFNTWNFNLNLENIQNNRSGMIPIGIAIISSSVENATGRQQRQHDQHANIFFYYFSRSFLSKRQALEKFVSVCRYLVSMDFEAVI